MRANKGYTRLVEGQVSPGVHLRLGVRFGVSSPVIIGGLLVVITAVATGCDTAKQIATVEPTPMVPVGRGDVMVVYASRDEAPLLSKEDYTPLWGDLDADAQIIDRLLRAMEGGSPAEIEADLEFSAISLAINVRFLDGKTWSVRKVWKCYFTPEGRKTRCVEVPDHWHLLHRGEVVVSTALTDWFRRVSDYMPRLKAPAFAGSAAQW